jgi:hypothetical protein
MNKLDRKLFAFRDIPRAETFTAVLIADDKLLLSRAGL